MHRSQLTPTRRHVLGAAGAAGLAVLAGCGGSGKDSTASPTTRSVTDFSGPVAVPVHPQRVVAADAVSLGHIASLGVTPVAAAVNPNSLPHYQTAQMKGTVDVTGGDSMDLEKALSTNPDLIVTVVGTKGDLFNSKQYKSYQKAMTTFGYLYGFAHIEEIESAARAVASALNRDAQAEQLIRDYDTKVAELRQRIITGKLNHLPVTTLRLAKGFYSIRMGSAEAVAFRALGMEQPKEQRDVDKFSIELSLEKFDILNEAETLFVYTDDNAAAENAKVMNSAIWKSLTPVKNKRVVEVNSGVWNGMDMQGLMIILKDIEKGFIAAHGA